MRHRKKTNHLSRKTAHRSALLSNMACSLIEHKRINTTLAKAKALRKYVEPLITKSKQDTTHNRRVVFSYLKNKYASSVLFRDVAPKINDRPGQVNFHLSDSVKFRKKFNWKPKIEIDQGINETVDWYKNNFDWWENKFKFSEIRVVMPNGKIFFH